MVDNLRPSYWNGQSSHGNSLSSEQELTTLYRPFCGPLEPDFSSYRPRRKSLCPVPNSGLMSTDPSISLVSYIIRSVSLSLVFSAVNNILLTERARLALFNTTPFHKVTPFRRKGFENPTGFSIAR